MGKVNKGKEVEERKGNWLKEMSNSQGNESVILAGNGKLKRKKDENKKSELKKTSEKISSFLNCSGTIVL